jgi:hypothetical protein
MRVLTVGLALAVLVARPAVAGRMLYATAATPSRIDGFCLRDNGSVAPTPSVRVELISGQPRRILVMDSVLYVVEDNRVEAFKIGSKGGLSSLGRTPEETRSGPRDIAVSPNKNMLYVPDRSRNRIVGHPLDAEGRPASDFTTCIQGDTAQGYQALVVNGDKLYVSSNGGNGRIQVFGINPDGSLYGTTGSPLVTDCRGATTEGPRPDPTPALSERKQIHDIKTFVVSGSFLYAEDRGRRRIKAFRLQPDGNFPPPTIENPNKPNKKTWPKAESKTEKVAQVPNDHALQTGVDRHAVLPRADRLLQAAGRRHILPEEDEETVQRRPALHARAARRRSGRRLRRGGGIRSRSRLSAGAGDGCHPRHGPL